MSITQENFRYIQQYVYNRSAIVLGDDKQYLVESRLAPISLRFGWSNLNELVARLRIQPVSPLGNDVVDAMTTNETSFFRDVAPFEALQSIVLPDLIQRRGSMRTIRVWSAACSSGQEPYSLAMLWRENFSHLADWQFKVLATDLSKEMLARASEGCYGDVEINRGLSQVRRDRFFNQQNGAWKATPQIRSLIAFRPLNLNENWPNTIRADIIVLRNVLVYFDLAAKQSILRRLRSALAPDGYLLLGGAETTIMVDDGFERVSACGSSYYRLKS